jgi:hypothetical protein
MCEPHASGSNRCAFCKTEVAVQRATHQAEARLSDALECIRTIAVTGDRTHSPTMIRAIADAWLDANGYESGEALRERRARIARAEELDAEIERLRAERAKL